MPCLETESSRLQPCQNAIVFQAFRRRPTNCQLIIIYRHLVVLAVTAQSLSSNTQPTITRPDLCLPNCLAHSESSDKTPSLSKVDWLRLLRKGQAELAALEELPLFRLLVSEADSLQKVGHALRRVGDALGLKVDPQ